MRLRCVFFKSIQLLLIGFLFYSYAMFQGGAVSYTLFYAVCFILLYLALVMMYPVHHMRASIMTNRNEIEAGESLSVAVEVKRRWPLPFVFMTVTLPLPQTLSYHFKGTQTFLNGTWTSQEHALSRTVLLGFNRLLTVHFDLDHLPRGKHQFDQVEIAIEDSFLFSKKMTRCETKHTVHSYPIMIEKKTKRIPLLVDNITKMMHPYQQRREDMAGVREYVTGDKISQIDWKKSSKQSELFTKQFDPKPKKDMLFLLDVGGDVIENEWALTVLYHLMTLFDRDKQTYRVNLTAFRQQALYSSMPFKQKKQKLAELSFDDYDFNFLIWKKSTMLIVISSQQPQAISKDIFYQLKKQRGTLILTSEKASAENITGIHVHHLAPTTILGGAVYDK